MSSKRFRGLLQPRFLVGLLVSLFFLIWLFSGTELDQVLQVLSGANYWLLPPAILLGLLGLWVRALRWQVLLLPFQRVPVARLFTIITIGYMANSLLPARAGELLRAYLLGQRTGIGKATLLAGIALERLLDGVLLLGILAMALAQFPFQAEWLSDLVRYAVFFFLGVSLAFLGLVARPALTRRLVGSVLKVAPRRVRPLLAQIADGFLEGLRVLADPRIALTVIAVSLLGWLVDIAMAFAVLWAFSVSAPLPLMAIDIAAANLGTTAPASAGGIGPFEFFAAEALKLSGYDSAVSTAYALLLHFAFIVPVILLGFFFLWRESARPAAIVSSAGADQV